MTLPFTRAAWRPLCSAAVLGAALWAAGASAAERRFDPVSYTHLRAHET
ncbi:hypothetical protein ACQUHV_20850, partial [Pseudomonas aeruginosa]